VVEPLLVLVGIKPPPAVRVYEKQGRLRVFAIESKDVLQRSLQTGDAEGLQKLVRDHPILTETGPTGGVKA